MQCCISLRGGGLPTDREQLLCSLFSTLTPRCVQNTDTALGAIFLRAGPAAHDLCMEYTTVCEVRTRLIEDN